MRAPLLRTDPRTDQGGRIEPDVCSTETLPTVETKPEAAKPEPGEGQVALLSSKCAISADEAASSKLVDGIAAGRRVVQARRPDAALADLVDRISEARLLAEQMGREPFRKRLRDFYMALAASASDDSCDWKDLAKTLRAISKDEEIDPVVRAQAGKLDQRVRRGREKAIPLFAVPVLMRRYVSRAVDRAAALHLEALGYPIDPLGSLLERGFFESAAAIAKHWQIQHLDPTLVRKGLAAALMTAPDAERDEALAEIASRSGIGQEIVDAAVPRGDVEVAASVKRRCPEVAVDALWLRTEINKALFECDLRKAIVLAEGLGWPEDIVLRMTGAGHLHAAIIASKCRDLGFIGREAAIAGIKAALDLRAREREAHIPEFAALTGIPAQEAYDLVLKKGGVFAAKAFHAQFEDLRTDPDRVLSGVKAALPKTNRGRKVLSLPYTESELADFALLAPSAAVLRTVAHAGRAATVADLAARGHTVRLDRATHAEGVADALGYGWRYGEEDLLVIASLPSDLEPQIVYDRMVGAGRFDVASKLHGRVHDIDHDHERGLIPFKTDPDLVLEGLEPALSQVGERCTEQNIIDILAQVEPTQYFIDRAARFGSAAIVASLVDRGSSSSAMHLLPAVDAAGDGTMSFMTKPGRRRTESDVLAWSEWSGHPRLLQELAADAKLSRAAEEIRDRNPFPEVAELLSVVLKAKVEIWDDAGDGRLDPSVRLRVVGALDVGAAKLGERRFLDLLLRSAIIEAGEELALSSCVFAGLAGLDRVNPNLWTMSKSGRMQVRKFLADGRIGSPAAAYRDMMKPNHYDGLGQSMYAFECAAANQIVLAKGILNFLERFYGATEGEVIFDGLMTERRFPSIYKWDVKPDLLDEVLVLEEGEGDLIPGSQYHYLNPETKPPWGGENVIALGREPRTGRQLFLAHGVFSPYRASPDGTNRQISIVSEDELLRKLKTLQAPGASIAPYRECYRNSVDVAKLIERAERMAAKLGVSRKEGQIVTEVLRPRRFLAPPP